MSDEPFHFTMPIQYVLINGVPTQETDVAAWADWMGRSFHERVVDYTRVRRRHRGQVLSFRVSTVFLGLDHNYGGDGPPLLWETAVIRKQAFLLSGRYASLGEAKKGHWEVVLHAKRSPLRRVAC